MRLKFCNRCGWAVFAFEDCPCWPADTFPVQERPVNPFVCVYCGKPLQVGTSCPCRTYPPLPEATSVLLRQCGLCARPLAHKEECPCRDLPESTSARTDLVLLTKRLKTLELVRDVLVAGGKLTREDFDAATEYVEKWLNK